MRPHSFARGGLCEDLATSRIDGDFTRCGSFAVGVDLDGSVKAKSPLGDSSRF